MFDEIKPLLLWNMIMRYMYLHHSIHVMMGKSEFNRSASMEIDMATSKWVLSCKWCEALWSISEAKNTLIIFAWHFINSSRTFPKKSSYKTLENHQISTIQGWNYTANPCLICSRNRPWTLPDGTIFMSVMLMSHFHCW